jgi:hypothetical protein
MKKIGALKRIWIDYARSRGGQQLEVDPGWYSRCWYPSVATTHGVYCSVRGSR